MNSLLRKPTAWLPIAISLAALLFVLVYSVLFGITHSQDERTPARVFQLMMLFQFSIIMIFAITWVPCKPGEAIKIIILQTVVALLPLLTILVLERGEI